MVLDGSGPMRHLTVESLREAARVSPDIAAARITILSLEDIWTALSAGNNPLEDVAVAVYLPASSSASPIERAVRMRQSGWTGETVVVWPMIPDASLALRWPWAHFVGHPADQSQAATAGAIVDQVLDIVRGYLVTYAANVADSSSEVDGERRARAA